MLTKNLLKVRTQSGHVVPQFLDPENAKIRGLAKEMIAVFADSLTHTFPQIQEHLENSVTDTDAPYFQGFAKLLFDRGEFSGLERDDFEARRWDIFQEAQRLRQETYFQNRQEFQETFAHEYGESSNVLSSSLYGDLPDFQTLKKFEEWTEQGLIHRYNCALVQGLLLSSPQVEVEISGANAREKRNLFRAIRFHRLVVGDITNQNDRLSFVLSGPLSVLVGTHAYGARLANFFPRILLLNKWTIRAQVTWKNKPLRFEITDRQGLRSHYEERGDYIPEEIGEFLRAYNETNTEWSASWSEEFVALGGQNFCFPDLMFCHVATGKKIYLEMFHRWHSGELVSRLGVLEKTSNANLILGICNSLYKQTKMNVAITRSQEKLVPILIFTGFPGIKAINSLLNERV